MPGVFTPWRRILDEGKAAVSRSLGDDEHGAGEDGVVDKDVERAEAIGLRNALRPRDVSLGLRPWALEASGCESGARHRSDDTKAVRPRGQQSERCDERLLGEVMSAVDADVDKNASDAVRAQLLTQVARACGP